jgi:hypothetical protein
LGGKLGSGGGDGGGGGDGLWGWVLKGEKGCVVGTGEGVEEWCEIEIWDLLPLKTSVVGGLRQMSVPGSAVMVNMSVGAMMKVMFKVMSEVMSEVMFEDRQFRSLEGVRDMSKMMEERVRGGTFYIENHPSHHIIWC